MNLLARHGLDFELAPVFKMEALKSILGTGNTRDHFDQWFVEQISVEQILKKVKDEARAAKLDTDVSQGRAGVAMGEQVDLSKQPGPQQLTTGEGQWNAELYAFNGKGGKGGGKNKRSRSPSRGYGKGMDKGGDKGKGKGKAQQTNLNATADRPSNPPAWFHRMLVVQLLRPLRSGLSEGEESTRCENNPRKCQYIMRSKGNGYQVLDL